jgi:hypothetical protein
MSVQKIRATPRLLVGGLVAAAVAVGSVVAFSVSADAAQSGILADELPPTAVEDFNYPGADRILAEQGLALKRGDGHLILTGCVSGDPDVLRLAQRGADGGFVCFRLIGSKGHLTLEMPSVYGTQTGAFNTELTLTPSDGGASVTYDVPPRTSEALGESDPDVGVESTLVEIRLER